MQVNDELGDALLPEDTAASYLRDVLLLNPPSVKETLARARAEAEGYQGDSRERCMKYRSAVRVVGRSYMQSPTPPDLDLDDSSPALDMMIGEEGEDLEPACVNKVLPPCKNKLCAAAGSNAFVTLRFDQRRSADEGMSAIYICRRCETRTRF